ncbi:MAG: hypothetical protein J0M02_18305, partial [Planctomycetes bacterium]|nr:hypothetical protein [Planctomycetota bacterium]
AAVALAALAAWLLWPTPPESPSATVGGPATTRAATPAQPQPGTSAPNDPGSEIERRDAARIAALADRLRREGEGADAREIGAQLTDIAARALTPANRQRVDELRGRLEEILRRRRAETDRNALAELETETNRLVLERNWDLAVRRIDAFKAKDDPALAQRIQRLRGEIAADKKQFLTSLDEKMKAAQAQKSLPRLRDLREQLPKSLLGGEVENKLTAAITALEGEQRNALAGEAAAAAADLARWEFAKVAERHAKARQALGDSSPGRQLDDYLAASKRLPDLVTAIGAELQKGRVRFRGTLGGWQDPDMEAASAKALTLAVDNGGAVEMAWAKLSAPELITIGQSILRDGFEPYRAAVNVLAAAKVGSEK